MPMTTGVAKKLEWQPEDYSQSATGSWLTA